MCGSRVARARCGVSLGVTLGTLLLHLAVGLGLGWGALPGSPLVGAALAGALLDFLGRKPVMALTAPLLAAATLCRVFEVPEVASRACVGAALGVSVSSSLFYLAETNPGGVGRGARCCLPGLATLLGRTLAHALGPLLPPRYLALLSPPPAVLGLLILLCCPESPVFLARRGRGAALLHGLARLRGQRDEHAVHGEAQELLVAARQAGWCGGGRGVALAVLLCGTLPLTASALEEARAGPLFGLGEPLLSVAGGLTQLAGVAVCALLVDLAGRRPLALLGCFLVVVAHAGTGAFLFLAEPAVLAFWLPVTTSVVFALGLAVLSSAAWVVLAESLPARAKCYVPAVVFLLDAALQAVVVCAQELVAGQWRFLLYWVSAGWVLLLGVVVAAALPECRQLPLLQALELMEAPCAPCTCGGAANAPQPQRLRPTAGGSRA